MTETPIAALPRRVHELDGIRGWAALGVAIFHLFNAVFGISFPLFRSFPFLVFSGPFAVALFFVLSGEALSSAFSRTGNRRAIAKLMVKRHSRLSIPIFFSVLLAMAVQRAGLVFNVEAADYIGANGWLAMGLPEPISLLHAAKFSFLDVYMTPDPNFQYNPFSWTMCIEMIGSIVVFAALVAIPEIRSPDRMLLAVAIVLFAAMPGGWISDFLIGVLYGRLRTRGVFDNLKTSAMIGVGSGATFLFIIMLSGVTLFYGLVRADCVLAALAAGVIYSGRYTSRFFSTWLSRALGRISFALYLCQFAVLDSFTSYLIVRWHAELDIWWAVLICFLSLGAMIAVAILFEPVERLTAWVGKVLVRAVVPDANQPETVSPADLS